MPQDFFNRGIWGGNYSMWEEDERRRREEEERLRREAEERARAAAPFVTGLESYFGSHGQAPPSAPQGGSGGWFPQSTGDLTGQSDRELSMLRGALSHAWRLGRDEEYKPTDASLVYKYPRQPDRWRDYYDRRDGRRMYGMRDPMDTSGMSPDMARRHLQRLWALGFGR